MGNDKIKKILIAGGTGFIGSRLANKLVSLGFRVAVLDNLAAGQKESLSSQVKFYLGDITNKTLVEKIFKKEKPDMVINQAAKVYWAETGKDLALDVATSVLGTINLLRNCLKYNVKKFIFASSISVYGQPNKIKVKETASLNFENMPNVLFSYGFSKYCAERYIRYFYKQYGLKYTILRYAHVYGPGQEDDVIAKFINRAVNNKKVIIYGDGEQCRDYLFIDDAVRAAVFAIKKGDNMLLNIGSGRKTSVNKLIKEIRAATKLNINFAYAGKKPDRLKAYMDISLARKKLGWQPAISLRAGIIKTYKAIL
jgi:UDP-glucose 4-epimerase